MQVSGRLTDVRAKIAAAYLYADDADPAVWRGLSDRNVNYEEIIDRTGPLVLRTVCFDLDRSRFAIDELGERACVQAVHSEDNPALIIDILAWSATRRHLYGTFFGQGTLGIWKALLDLRKANGRGYAVRSSNLCKFQKIRNRKLI